MGRHTPTPGEAEPPDRGQAGGGTALRRVGLNTHARQLPDLDRIESGVAETLVSLRQRWEPTSPGG